MKAKVISYDVQQDFNICETEDGKTLRVDIVVDGGLGNVSGKDLVGKTVEWEYTYPYVIIASGVRIV